MNGGSGAPAQSGASPSDISTALVKIEYMLCKEFSGFSLNDLDNTDIDSLIPFILFALEVNRRGTPNQDEEYMIINGKKYKKAKGNKFSCGLG
jgi:hypothetical protein